MIIRTAALCALLCACQRDFAVLAPVAHPPPVLGAFTPTAAWAGTRVTVEARNFGADPAGIEVHFGGSRAVTPLSVTATALVAQVPDDASSGPVTVVSALGRGATHDAFTARGLGRLRLGRIGRQADLRTHLAAAVPFGTRYAVLDDHYGFAGRLSGSGSLQPFEVRRPAAIASAGSTIVVVDSEWNRDGCGGSAAHLAVITSADGSVDSSTCLPMPLAMADDDSVPIVAAVDEAGTHALVVADGNRLWLVDLTVTPPRVQASAISDSAPFTSPGAVWVGGTRFVFLDAGDLRSIDWSVAAPVPSDPFSTSGTAAVMAATSLGKLVYAGPRSIYTVDATTWPPTETAHVSTLSTADPTGIAVDAGFTRAAIALRDAGRVVTYDLATLAPLVSTPVEEARAVSLASGAFVVAGRGSVALLSQSTGLPVGGIAVKVQPGAPVVRALPGGATFIDLPLQALGTLLRVEPRTLHEVPWTGVLGLPAVREIFPLPDGSAVYLHGDELRRSHLAAGVETEDLDHVYPTPDPGFGGSPLQLGISADGSTLLFQWGESGSLLSNASKLGLLDTSAQWTATSAQVLDLPDLSERALAPDPQHLVLVQGHAIRVLDLAQARAGVVKELWTVPLPGESLRSAFAGGLFFDVASAGADGAAVLQIASTTEPRSLATPPAIAAFSASESPDALTAALGARRLYWLSRTAEEGRLETVDVDPDTGAVNGQEPSIKLPVTASDLLAYPDGEHLLVVDSGSDQLLLLE